MQQRIRNFKHPLQSFDHNVFNLGFHNPGRYMGFDTIIKLSTLTFKLGHAQRNLLYTDTAGNIIGPIGACLTPQGTIIQETESVGPFTIQTNQGNPKIRYDLIYMDHDQVELNGGQDAVYKVIKGTINDSTKPVVPNPQKNTPIAYIEIPANEVTIDNCTLLKERCPDSGDGPDARLDDVNLFQKFQSFSASARYISPTIKPYYNSFEHHFWELANDANTFLIFPEDEVNLDAIMIKNLELRKGARINILINEHVSLRSSSVTADYGSLGYVSFSYNSKFNTVISQSLSFDNYMKPTAGEIWELEMVLLESVSPSGFDWNITKIGGRVAGNVYAKTTPPYTDNVAMVLVEGNDRAIYVPNPILKKGTYGIGNVVSTPGYGMDVAINFGTPLPTSQYMVFGTIVSKGANAHDDTNVFWTLIDTSRTINGFSIHLIETDNTDQNLDFDYLVLAK